MRYLALFSLFFIFCCSCGRGPAGTDVWVDEGLANALLFAKSSYWIYTDSVSGATDSFYVNTYSDDVAATTPHDPREAVRKHNVNIYITQRSNRAGDTIYHSWNYHMWEHYLNISHQDISGKKTPLYKSGNLQYPFRQGNDVVLTSYAVGGVTYPNVTIISIVRPGICEEQLYLAPNKGLVKIRMRHMEDTAFGSTASFSVLELQRCVVVGEKALGVSN